MKIGIIEAGPIPCEMKKKYFSYSLMIENAVKKNFEMQNLLISKFIKII